MMNETHKELDMIELLDFNEISDPKEGYVHSDITRQIIGVCFDVYNSLGTGFLEIIYKDAIELELKNKGISFEREKQYKIIYKNTVLKHHYYADFVVEGKVILEVKAQQGLVEENMKQVLNYLAVSKCRIGLIINFTGKSLQYKRIIL